MLDTHFRAGQRRKASSLNSANKDELAPERLLICRLHLRLLHTITDYYGAEFASQSDSLAYRTIGIYVFLRTVMCSPVRASQVAHALKLPRVSVLRRLEEMIKHGYVERVGNAYRVTDKVNIAELRSKLQRRIDMMTETAKRLAKAVWLVVLPEVHRTLVALAVHRQ
jgi:DNA-binding MarR family transcriptional regulator